MRQSRAESLADEIVNDYRSNPEGLNYREAIIRHLLHIKECDGCPSVSEALNMGDGSYKP